MRKRISIFIFLISMNFLKGQTEFSGGIGKFNMNEKNFYIGISLKDKFFINYSFDKKLNELNTNNVLKYYSENLIYNSLGIGYSVFNTTRIKFSLGLNSSIKKRDYYQIKYINGKYVNINTDGTTKFLIPPGILLKLDYYPLPKLNISGLIYSQTGVKDFCLNIGIGYRIGSKYFESKKSQNKTIKTY
jgi:hypothetical protein